MFSRKTFAHLLMAGTFSAFGITVLAWDAFAQPPAPAPTKVAEAPKTVTPAPPTGNKERKVKFKGDRYKYVERTGIYDLIGNVRFTSEDTVMTTEAATYSKKTKIASSPGSLKIEDTLNTVVGKTGTAYYQTRDIKLRGDVLITVRPKDQDKNLPEDSPRRQFDSPANITCQSLDYNWGSRVGVLTGGLTVKQKDRTVTADKATYFGKEEQIRLEGNVIYTTTKGEKGQAKTALIIFKEGEEEFQAEGEVQGEGFVEDTIEENPTPPKTEKPQPEPGKPNPTTPPTEPQTPDPGIPPPGNSAPTGPPTPPTGNGTK